MKDRLKRSNIFSSDFRTPSREWRRDVQIEICLICSRIGEKHEFMG